MKITINRRSGILTLPDDFATLADVTDDARFHYVVKYNVDAYRAVRDRSVVVKIHVSTSPGDEEAATSFANLNNAQVIQNLLTRPSAQKEINRALVQDYIVSLTSDITSKIPNDKTAQITLGASQNALFQRTAFQLVRASDLTSRNIAQPVFQTPLTQPLAQSVVAPRTVQEQAMSLILNHAIDPASVGVQTNQYASTARVYSGINQQLGGVARDMAQTTAPVSSLQARFGLMAAALGTPQDRPATQQGLASNDHVPVLVRETTNIVTIEEDVFIPISAIGDQFYLIFELQDIHGVEAEKVSSVVHHSRNLSVFTIPTIPPKVSAVALSGYNRLEITQMDPNAAGVYIYRRAIGEHIPITDAEYVQIEKFPIRVSDGTRWFQDRFPGLKSVIYRLVPYNRAEMKSFEFGSMVVNPSKKVLSVRSTQLKKRLFLSVYAKVVDKSIQLEISDVPPDALTLEVYRQDLSRYETLEESTKIGNTIFLGQTDTKEGRFYATDKDVIDQRVYEYSILITFRDGTQLWSTSHSNVHYTPALNNSIDTKLGPIRAVNTGTELDIQFTITSVVVDGKYDRIKKTMEQQGILGFFQDDLTTNRDLLQSLVAYQIDRTNLTTGEKESMGTFIGTNFSDRTVGKNLGVKSLQPTHTYEYTVSTYFRTAESMIETFTKSVEYSNNANMNYDFKPSKWKHPVTLRDGNIVSSNTLRRNHAFADFTLGTVGDITYTRLTLSDETPTIQNATARSIGPGRVMIQWQITGSPKKIDHFLVMKEELGMRTVVGKTHAITDTNSLYFIDETKSVAGVHAITSAVEYHIVPVLYDYTHGAPVKTTQIVTQKK